MAVGVVLVLFVGIAISLLGQFGQGVEDEAGHRGLAFATDDLGVSRAPDQVDTVSWRHRSFRLTIDSTVL